MGTKLKQQVQQGVIAAAVAGLVSAIAVAQPPPAAALLVCESKANELIVCPAETSAGVVLVTSTGPAACLLGKTSGYDDGGVWVAVGVLPVSSAFDCDVGGLDGTVFSTAFSVFS